MSPLVWIILLVIVIPMVGLLAWVIVSASIVRIPPGRSDCCWCGAEQPTPY